MAGGGFGKRDEERGEGNTTISGSHPVWGYKNHYQISLCGLRLIKEGND